MIKELLDLLFGYLTRRTDQPEEHAVVRRCAVEDPLDVQWVPHETVFVNSHLQIKGSVHPHYYLIVEPRHEDFTVSTDDSCCAFLLRRPHPRTQRTTCRERASVAQTNGT